MASSPSKATVNLRFAKPFPTASYRSPLNPGLIHLRVPSDRLAQFALASSNNPVTTASSSTNPPTPNRTSTPTGTKDNVPASRLDNNNNSSSRAASAAPADRTVDRVTIPTEPAAHGAPTRQYLNSKLTYHVMEGMKIVAKEQPADPLRVLGEFLLKRSGDLERAAAANGTPAAEGDKENLKQNGDITTEQ
ncbi:COMPASS (complex proteins associated with Set1p) component [Diaporthe australafricana]|uniref:COMPASS (Complex proteins associated with Set1p) component n=1 Tax=Diaporthe australafricana TaxID=127596 RepID=A0ABR3W749_9PEZI